jgi:hypothetical protein
VGHKLDIPRKKKPSLIIPRFGYVTITLYDLETLYAERFTTWAENQRLQKEIEAMKKNTSKQIISFIGFTLAVLFTSALCVSVIYPPAVSDRYILGTQELSATPSMDPVVLWCDEKARAGMPIVPAKWVERTPGAIRENEVCNGGADGSYIGACPCIYPNSFVNFSGTVSYVWVVNGTPQLSPPVTPTSATESTRTPVPATFTPSPTITPSRTKTAQPVTVAPVFTPTKICFYFWGRKWCR